MKHLLIGPATVATDPVALTAGYTIADLTVEGAPPVPSGTGADAYNSITIGWGDLEHALTQLGLMSLFINPWDGLLVSGNEARTVAIDYWMSVRIDAALVRFEAANPDIAELPEGALLRFAYDLGQWLAFWFAWALEDGIDTGPAAFMWSEN